jgi:hypothetical protein
VEDSNRRRENIADRTKGARETAAKIAAREAIVAVLSYVYLSVGRRL